MKRNRAVIFTGTKVHVFAKGDNRICSTSGDITLRFGKGRANRANLGSGNDRVIIASRARVNHLDLGDGNNTAIIKNRANKQIVKSGSGNDRITIAHKANIANVDTGDGNNRVVLAGKANRQKVVTGNGDDHVIVKTPAKANRRLLKTGLGDDVVEVRAEGNTTAYLSEKTNPASRSDTDTYYGGPSNDTVYTYHGGTIDNPNRIHGGNGSDKLYSLASAYSHLHGGDGSDWLYSASSGTFGDRLIGGRGNDRLFADRGSGPNVKGAFLDGNEGDDWFRGTDADDVIVALSGIKKIKANGGDDLILKTGIGIGTINGGPGYNTISYIAHTPPGYWTYSGVMVDLQAGKALNGKGIDTIRNIDHVIGSQFDDLLTGKNGVANRIDGGMGNDTIEGSSQDQIDGGPGINTCTGGQQARCNGNSSGEPNPNKIALDIGAEGILTVIGSVHGDKVKVGYDMLDAAYVVDVNRPVELSRECVATTTANRYSCPADRDLLSLIVVEGNAGDDDITVDYTMPEEVTAIINGGTGHDTVLGGLNKDIVGNAEKVDARHGDDMIYATDGSVINGGPGSDAIHIANPCVGGFVSGGQGARDTVVFAGAKQGVNANLVTGRAKWKHGKCANPIRLSKDLDGLEGSKHDDILVASKHKKTSLLGRDGADIFRARNGVRDVITTGGGGKTNKVYADRFDKVTWGWGLAGY